MISIVAALIYIPLTVYKGSIFFASFQDLLLVVFLTIAIPSILGFLQSFYNEAMLKFVPGFFCL
jgi:hypothetical protein